MDRAEARSFRSARQGRLFLKLGPDRRPIEDEHGRRLVAVGGCRFEDIPLRYLDWLSGQPWVYGELRQRLTRYLRQDHIQRQAADEFRDRELDDSGFTIQDSLKDRWHGQPMPAEQAADSFRPSRIRPRQQWQWLAELWLAIDSAHLVHELPACEGLAALFIPIYSLDGVLLSPPPERLAQVRFAWELARRTLPTS
jgi:hypothetical protein